MTGVELEFATRQLATLLRAGLPLERALLALAEQAEKKTSKRIYARLCDAVREGASLAQALQEFPKTFSAAYSALVAAGERSGSLPAVLERVADDLETRNQLKASLTQALAYPLIVTVVAIFILGLLLGYVVPQIVEVLKAQGQGLPWLTWLLINLSEFLSQWASVIGLAIAVLTVGTWLLWKRSETMKNWLDRQFLRLPAAGKMVQLSEAARLCNTLSVMLAGGVPLTTGLSMSAQSCSTRTWSRKLNQVQGWVQEGAGLASAMQRANGFPSLLVQLVATGERTGALSELLRVGAKEFSRELKMRSSLLVIALEPALILGMGLVVLVIVMAVMMPLIDMNRLIQ